MRGDGSGRWLKKIVGCAAGIILIRYVSAADTSRPPQVIIASEELETSDLEIILPPDADRPILWSPGGSLVVRAGRPGRLVVTIISVAPGGSTAADVQLVQLSEDPLGCRPTGPVDLSTVQVLGHLSGIGDVRVACNEWLGGPTAPKRIEGIALEGLPNSVRLRYSARIGGPKPAATQMVDAGNFAGTRGRALPLVGVTLESPAPDASQYTIASNALFLGSPMVRASGQRVVLAGPTRREPLVGLQVSIAEVALPATDTAAHWVGFEPDGPVDDGDRPLAQSKPAAGAKSSGSTRVFRSRAPQPSVENVEPSEAKEHKVPPVTPSKSKVKVFSREQLKVNRE